MDRTERFYKIDRLLRDKGVVRLEEFLRALDISRATFKRDLEYMRDRLHAPIEWDREKGGYRLTSAAPGMPNYQLPGLWFNSSEIRALLAMQQLLADVQPGLLEPHIEPLQARLRSLLGARDHSAADVERRIRLVHVGKRAMSLPHFETVADAVLRRQRLHIVYTARGSNEKTAREISPHRLVHYRENWYVDAWCHLREDIRSFAVDAVQAASLLDKKIKAVPDKELDEVLGAGYGIFSGRKVSWARLRFSAESARWVSAEQWHPRQKAHFEPDGHYILELPYSDPRELAMDILRHGPAVEVLSPAPLRELVRKQLQAALAQY